MVHDPALDAGVTNFRLLAKQGDLLRRQAAVREIEQSRRKSDLERCRGTQATADRQVAVNNDVGAAEFDAFFFEQGDDPSRVCSSQVEHWHPGLVQVEGARFVHAQRIDVENPVATRCRCNPGVQSRGCGQHQAFIVIGMFADDVDPAWRTIQSRLLCAGFCELVEEPLPAGSYGHEAIFDRKRPATRFSRRYPAEGAVVDRFGGIIVRGCRRLDAKVVIGVRRRTVLAAVVYPKPQPRQLRLIEEQREALCGIANNDVDCSRIG